MSATEHRSTAPSGPFGIRILVISSSRTLDSDEAGARAAELFAAAGHLVLGRSIVADEVNTIRAAVRHAAAEPACQAVFLTGGTGLSASDVTPEALSALYTRAIPGFGELFRQLSFADVGSAAMLSRATAGLVGRAVAFAVPGSPAAVELAVHKLILPELAHLVREVTKEGAAAVPVIDTPVEVVAEVPPAKAESPAPPPQIPRWRLGMSRMVVTARGTLEPSAAEVPEGAASHDLPDKGWLRAVHDLQGEVQRGKQPDIPQDLEKLAPFIDLLHAAGEYARLKTADGRTYTLYGYPDLQRPNSKVIAVGWGDPLGEVIALHRYPIQAGTSIDGSKGWMPSTAAPVAEVARAVTGSPPKSPSGSLFAVDADAVYILRDGRVVRWDGRTERVEGTPKQALVTLAVAWHQR
jgi:molybdenum cofactor biosynthesis protein B